jgi:osmotically-inducible protein OsmY
MARTLSILLSVVVLALLAFFFLGYRGGLGWDAGRPPGAPIGTTGVIDTDKARERGAELGEKAAVAGAKVGAAMGEASLTLKIKAKMALDDSVKARAIDVTTSGGTVTVSGKVASAAEHARAIELARETEGVERVIDHLEIMR